MKPYAHQHHQTPTSPVPTRRSAGWRVAVAALALLPLATAWADGGRAMPADMPPVYAQECGACHVAYPPGLLPAVSWQRLMGRLDRHYGTDASLDAAAARPIARWLDQHAGTYRRVTEAPPQDRISRAAWFERKHRRIEPATWQLPSVKSAANCGACHTRAERGDFDEHALRRPAGLSAAQQRAWQD